MKLHVGGRIINPVPYDARDGQDTRIPNMAPRDRQTEHRKTLNTKRKRRGRKRGPRSMGRFPFIVKMNVYLEESRLEGKADSTLKNENRMLRILHTDIQYLKQKGKMSNTDPTKFTQEDIMELVFYLRNRENRNNGGTMDANTVAKYIQYLKNLVDFCDNSVMVRLQMRNKLPKRYVKHDILTLDQEDALEVFKASQEGDGWNGAVMAFVIPVYLMMGFRASELQRAELRDVNIRKWTFFVRYPKGGQHKQTTMKIPTPLIPYFEKFLEARKNELNARGVKQANTLIPRLTKFTVKDRPLTPCYYWRLKKELEERLGFEFDFQMLRRTSGQLLLDADKNNLTVVQKHLRHSSTVVTQRYYAQMRDKAAAEVVEEVWSNSAFAKA